MQGVIDRFAEDLLRLSREQWEPHQAATAGALSQEAGEVLWWPMWWCPGPSQWSWDGVEGATLTADQTDVGRPVEADTQVPAALVQGVQSCRTKPIRRRSKKGKVKGSLVEPQLPEPDADQAECSGSSSSQSGSEDPSDSCGEVVPGTVGRNTGPAVAAVGGGWSGG